MILLGSETVVTTDFYLAILGVAALTVGILGATPFEPPIWGQWALFGVLSIGYLVFFRRRVYAWAGASPEPNALLEGEVAIAKEAIAPGEVGRAELRGATWTARNRGRASIEEGARMRVEEVDGLTIQVRLEAESEARRRHK